MANGQPTTEKEWRAEFERRGFITVQLQYMHGSFFHGPARGYAHRWLGEQEAKNKTAARRTTRIGWTLTSIVIIIASLGLGYNIASYNIQSRGDHASVHTFQLWMSAPAADATYWMQYIQNSGKEDAIGVKLKLGTIDPSAKSLKLLGMDEWVRIGVGVTASSQFLIYKKDFLSFFVTCLAYNDDRGQAAEELFFYKLPLVPQPNVGAPWSKRHIA